jgi:hypothetical protein
MGRNSKCQGGRIMFGINKAMLESYLRSLLGQVFAAVAVVMGAEGLASPLEFGAGEWILVANALWASLLPVALRYFNSKDPAFGRVAESVGTEVGKKLEAEGKKRSKKATK